MTAYTTAQINAALAPMIAERFAAVVSLVEEAANLVIPLARHHDGSRPLVLAEAEITALREKAAAKVRESEAARLALEAFVISLGVRVPQALKA